MNYERRRDAFGCGGSRRSIGRNWPQTWGPQRHSMIDARRRVRSLIPLTEIKAARERIEKAAIRTPLVRLNMEDGPAEVYLKLENLQPIGSFKIRGASNRMALASPAELEHGVWTASAGNMAQGVAWNARRLGVPCTVVVPETAPQTKLAAIERLGARIVKLPYARWWQVLADPGPPGIEGLFIHPARDQAFIGGNRTIGL